MDLIDELAEDLLSEKASYIPAGAKGSGTASEASYAKADRRYMKNLPQKRARKEFSKAVRRGKKKDIENRMRGEDILDDVMGELLDEGKAADGLVKSLKANGGSGSLTDLAAHPSLRGVHFASIERAAKTMVKRGKAKMSGNTLSLSESSHLDEGKASYDEMVKGLIPYLKKTKHDVITAKMLTYSFKVGPAKASAFLSKLEKEGKLVAVKTGTGAKGYKLAEGREDDMKNEEISEACLQEDFHQLVYGKSQAESMTESQAMSRARHDNVTGELEESWARDKKKWDQGKMWKAKVAKVAGVKPDDIQYDAYSGGSYQLHLKGDANLARRIQNKLNVNAGYDAGRVFINLKMNESADALDSFAADLLGEDEIQEGMRAGTNKELQQVLAKAKWPAPRRMHTKRTMDAIYMDRGTEVARVTKILKRGKVDSESILINAKYLGEGEEASEVASGSRLHEMMLSARHGASVGEDALLDAIMETASMPVGKAEADEWAFTEAVEKSAAESKAKRAFEKFFQFSRDLGAGKSWAQKSKWNASEHFVKEMKMLVDAGHSDVVKKYVSKIPKGYGFTLDFFNSTKSDIAKFLK